MFKGNEKEIIKELVDDILHLEDKIAEISAKKTNEPNANQTKEIDSILYTQQNNYTNIATIKSALTKQVEENNKVILAKEKDITKVKKSVVDIENKICQSTISASTTTQQSQSLGVYNVNYERISDIIHSKKTKDELRLLEQEYSNYQSNYLSVNQAVEDKCNKKRVLHENMIMMKEEKKGLQSELINLIAQKESLEEIVKNKLLSIKSKNKDTTINNCKGIIHTNLSISFSHNNNLYQQQQLQYNDSSITIIELYRYEIALIDFNKISKEISESLIESNEDIIPKTHLSNMIQNEIIDYLSNHNWSHTIDDLLTIISIKAINILQSVPSIKVNLTEECLSSYIKTLFKISYYEKIISNTITFTSKEYKSNKKEFKKGINKLNEDISKLTIKKEEIEAKIKENKYKMNILVDTEAIDGLGLTKEEKAFIELNDRITQLNQLKENILLQINELNSNNEEITKEANKKINELTVQNTTLSIRKRDIEEEIQYHYLKSNEELTQLRQMIADKFKLIKTELRIYKEQYGDNIQLYNELVESINFTLRISKNVKLPTSSLITLNDETKLIQEKSHNNKANVNHAISPYKIPNNFRIRLNNKNIKTTKNRNRNSSYVSTSNKQFLINDIILNDFMCNNHPSSITKSSRKSGVNNSTLNDPLLTLSKTKDKTKTDNHTHSSIPLISPTRNKHKHNYSINNNANITSSLWDDERMKLEKSIHKLKTSISNNSKCVINNDNHNIKAMNNIQPIPKSTFCYFRILERKKKSQSSQYNPLEHSVNNKEFEFVKANISVNTETGFIVIKDSNHCAKVKEISIDDIDNTAVTNTMKHVIKIYRSYRRAQMKDMMNIEDFVKKEEFKDIPLNSNEKIKAAVNQFFNMTIKLKVNQRIELVFITYDDFKLWLNGIALILKNKN